MLPTASLHPPGEASGQKVVMGGGGVSEVKMGSGFANPAMSNSVAGSQGEWRSVAPNLRIVVVHNPKGSHQKIGDLGPNPTL